MTADRHAGPAVVGNGAGNVTDGGVGDAEPHLLSLLAHALSSAATPLRLHARVLADAGLEGRLGDAAAAAQALADRLASLSAEMLDAARLREGRLVLRPSAVDVADEVAKAVRPLQAAAEARGVHLRLDGGPPCPALADGTRLQQVVANLVQNALEATPAGGQVAIATAHGAAGVRITVSDTGVGLRPEEAEGLFRPFQGLPPGHRAGFGLGLFVCRGIVAAHGGRITCRSDGPGRGTTFVVEIPARAAVQGEDPE